MTEIQAELGRASTRLGYLIKKVESMAPKTGFFDSVPGFVEMKTPGDGKHIRFDAWNSDGIMNGSRISVKMPRSMDYERGVRQMVQKKRLLSMKHKLESGRISPKALEKINFLFEQHILKCPWCWEKIGYRGG